MAFQHASKAQGILPLGPVVIRPKVAMYSAFSRLNYKPWFALAEFLDNSIQSYVVHRDRLHSKKAPKPHLTISIRIEDDRIKISDDAAGIAHKDFPRAFAPAQRPPDTSGVTRAASSLSFFAGEEIPRVDPTLPPEVSEVRFQADLSGLDCLTTTIVRDFGGIFAAALPTGTANPVGARRA